MTDKNVYVMDLIVSKMAEGDKLSRALKLVYNKRNVCIPYNENNFDVDLRNLKMTSRATNALLRAGLRTLEDVIKYCNNHKITDITNLGGGSGIEIFEAILDYSWMCMSKNERTSFLIDTVKRNQNYIRTEII